MDFALGFFTFGTLGFIIALAYLSVCAMRKLRDSDAPKSSLARDGIEERRRPAASEA